VLQTGFSRPGSINAYGFGGGLSAKLSRVVGFASFDVSAYPGASNPRFRRETFSNGQSVCRDLSTGQFAASESCSRDVDTITAGMFDANVLLPRMPFMAGVGYRTGLQKGGYGSLGFAKQFRSSNNLWFLRGLAGRDFWQVNIGIAAYWPR
jgi:hypothetical protein